MRKKKKRSRNNPNRFDAVLLKHVSVLDDSQCDRVTKKWMLSALGDLSLGEPLSRVRNRIIKNLTDSHSGVLIGRLQAMLDDIQRL